MWVLVPAFAEPSPVDPDLVALRDRVADLRGHPFALVPFVEATPEEAVAYQDETFTDFLTPEGWRVAGLPMVATDQLSAGASLLDAWLELARFGAYGYYDPLARRFVLVRRPEGEFRDDQVLGHELVHVLQDQVYDLAVYRAPGLENGDVGNVGALLLEGDAEVLGRVLELGDPAYDLDLRELVPGPPLDGPTNRAPPNVPVALFEQAMFAYPLGARFVRSILGPEHDWSAMDRVYAAPPTSTEQVLHPERYTGPARDDPTAVTLPLGRLGRDLPGFRPATTESLGELRIALMLRAWHQSAGAWDVADGWDGDRLVVLENEARDWVLVWRLRWDSEADAVDFVQALEQRWRDEPGYACEHRGPDVVVVRHVPQAQQPAVLASAWAARLREVSSTGSLIDRGALRSWVRSHPR